MEDWWRPGLLSPGRMDWWRSGRRLSHTAAGWRGDGGPPEKPLAWTHRRSFTLGVREDRYGQVGRLSGVDGWWRRGRWRSEVLQVTVVFGLSSSPSVVFLQRLKNAPFNGRLLPLQRSFECSALDPTPAVQFLCNRRKNDALIARKKHGDLGSVCRVQLI